MEIFKIHPVVAWREFIYSIMCFEKEVNRKLV
jgi:hypothetical protein